jgi:biotin synthase
VLCFMAGANAVFTGEKMLTTPCNGWDEDRLIFEKWGLRPMESFEVEALREEQRGADIPLEAERIHQASSVTV